MPSYTVKKRIVYIQVGGMSAELREEFHNFRRVTPIVPIIPVTEGKNDTEHYCNGFFHHRDLRKISKWFKEKRIELKVE